ncbi:DUF4430 domain-containing protein [Solirubrobacter soli]|uniref:DUF4430 domain-containing protein n=1 Tax=Solirubrobacter soli TaxID=363832 RepID=UPI00040D5664|nr:DUF4430 domain-containing protein [Solirubrobacter soli]
MKLTVITGTVAGLLAFAAPALAAPANVTVRVEGATTTRVETTRVLTTTAPVSRAGHDCSGTSAGGALDKATAGDWDAGYFDGLGHFIKTIKGETPSGDDYWSVWVNHKSSMVGACAFELQEGDDVLFFVDHCTADPTTFECTNAPVEPLAMTAPAQVQAGQAAELSVVKYDTTGKATPVEGATISGPGVSVTTDAAGKATATFPADGTVRLQATKAGLVRSETHDVVVATPTKGPPATVTPATPDKTAPSATLTGIKDKQIFKTGPRELKGSFGADPSGIKTVKLRLAKRSGGKCWYFSGTMEKFRRTACGTEKYFAIGDRADWTYLLPARLGKGRYTLDAIAIDGAGNRTPLVRGTTQVVFTVR